MGDVLEHIPAGLGRVTFQYATERGLSPALIRWFTRSPWSHVDFVLPSGRLLGARLKGGVQVRPPDYARFSRIARAHLVTPQAPAIYEFALRQVGKPYDWRAVIAFAFARDWRDAQAWFCSELQERACEAGGEPLVNPRVPVNRIAPADTALSIRLRY